MTTQRIAAGVEYCGVHYGGWQVQANVDSVQARVEAAVGAVADEAVRVHAAGRTDAGVHGLGQVIHFDTVNVRDARAWLRGVNTHLPNDIALLWTRPVADDFHARFAARARSYRYVILNRAPPPACLHGRVAHHYAPLTVESMRDAAAALVGTHDFTSFRSAHCQAKHPRRTVTRLDIGAAGEWVWIDIRADGFLYKMVRNIAGALLHIGEGNAPPSFAAQLLAARDRARAPATAAAAGLYFTAAEYDDKFALPLPPAACKFW